MDRLDRYLGVHADALGLQARRMDVLASNIANAATPGFKARDLDFAAVLAPPTKGAALRTTHQRHLTALPGESGEAQLRFRQPIQPSLDGNTVELATEQVQFAENALRYRTTLSVLNGRFSTLASAMRNE